MSDKGESLGPWKRRFQRRKVDALVKVKNSDGKV
jgi:hypothetical protein